MNTNDDQPGSLQLLKNEWFDLIAQLGLLTTSSSNSSTSSTSNMNNSTGTTSAPPAVVEDSGHFHPFNANVNLVHSQKVITCASNDIRHSLSFFTKLSTENKNSPTPTTNTPTPTNQTTVAETRNYFKQWKDHKKTCLQKSFLNETLDTCTNVLTDYCLLREREKSMSMSSNMLSSSSSSNQNLNDSMSNHSNNHNSNNHMVMVGGQRIVKIIQSLKRIAKHENQLNFIEKLHDDVNGGGGDGGKKKRAVDGNVENDAHASVSQQQEENAENLWRFEYFDYDDDGKHYYTIANSSFVLDIVTDSSNGVLCSVSIKDETLLTLNHDFSKNEKHEKSEKNEKSEREQREHHEEMVRMIRESYEYVNRDLYGVLMLGQYDVFERKVKLFFGQKRILERVKKCVASIGGATSGSSASDNDTTMRVFHTLERELWKRVRVAEMAVARNDVTMMQKKQKTKNAIVENGGSSNDDDVDGMMDDVVDDSAVVKQWAILHNDHGLIERKCEGLVMTYFSAPKYPLKDQLSSNVDTFDEKNCDYWSAILSIDEYSMSSSCPVLLLQPPIEIPMFLIQQLNQYTTGEAPEHFICHMSGDLLLSDALLMSSHRRRQALAALEEERSKKSKKKGRYHAKKKRKMNDDGDDSDVRLMMTSTLLRKDNRNRGNGNSHRVVSDIHDFSHAFHKNHHCQYQCRIVLPADASTTGASEESSSSNSSSNSGNGKNKCFVFHADQNETLSTPNSNAIIVSKIPFTQLSHIPMILESLRCQARFNQLYTQCFVPSSSSSVERQNDESNSSSTTDEDGDGDFDMNDDDDKQLVEQLSSHVVEVSIVPPLTIALRLVPSTGERTDNFVTAPPTVEVEVVSSKQVKVYLYVGGHDDDKIYSEEASQHLSVHNNLPLLLNHLLSKSNITQTGAKQ